MRRVCHIAAIVLMTLPLYGCWNRTELNELGITSATGMDFKDGKWSLTFQVVVPSAMWSGAGSGAAGGSGSQSSVHVFSTTGDTIREAVRNSYRSFSRKLYFSHTDVLVIGKQAAEEGIAQILDLYLRNFDARETVLVTVADGYASEILRQFVPPERLPGNALAKILLWEEKNSGMLPAVKVFDIAQNMYSDAKAIGVPEIVLQSSDDKGRTELKSMDIFKTTSKPARLKLGRIGAFKGDRLVGWLNDKEGLGVAWLKDNVKNSVLSFPCPSSGGGQGLSSYQIRRAKVQITPHLQDDRLTMHIRVKTKGYLMESTCQGNFGSPSFIGSLERELEKEISQEIETGWQAVLRLQLDLPGFADRVHRKYPRQWKNLKDGWEGRLKQIDLDVHVEAKLRNIGLTQNPITQKASRDAP